jgi:NDP-sugar pyrophosphorylase family protein
MAGAGSRFFNAGIKTPKPLIQVLGKTLIEHSIDSFDVQGRYIFITRSFENEADNETLAGIFNKKRPEHVEIRTDTMTRGAAETALLAIEHIDNNDPLVIFNCDQKLNWDPKMFLNFIENKSIDAAVVLYDSIDSKNSFAEIKDGKIVRFAEKEVISNHALIGFHYWRRGSDFVKSTKKLIDEFQIEGRPECYISETFNYLNTVDILPYHISKANYISLGTPEDLEKFIGINAEYMTDKPKTIFIDVDGTILKHSHSIKRVINNEPQALPGVVKKLNEWDSLGYKIIIVTARKESVRSKTEKDLQKLGIAWDQLIMGITSGKRILINDKIDVDSFDRASAINVLTDEGFVDDELEKFGL